MASDQSSDQLKKVPFSDLDGYVSEKTLKAIEEKGFTEMTEIQSHSIPHLLMGKDLLGAAKTGSGKTLAFLIPVIELILKKRFGAKKGTGAIIISPTRELAIQTYKVLEDLSKYHDYTYGMVIGGTNKMEEIKMLKDGVNILIATPGRLLDHLTNCNGFLYKNLKCLVFDEADKMLEHGFEKDLNEILEILPRERQTVLFSATQTKKTEDLARLSLNEEPIYVGVDDGKEHATVDGLNQGYLKCSMENKFRTLLAFLTNDPAQKVMVFFSSCMEVEFFSQLLSFINFPVMSVHGQQKQSKRTRITDEFREAKKATLLCTDVFGRGVDFEFVDLIIQYDAPDSPKEYIHRVGRTARGHDGKGRAVIFLPPEELEFLNFLKKEKIPIKEWSLLSELPDVQSVMEELVGRVPKLNLTAKEAFKTYIRAYNVRTNKKVFDVHRIDLAEVALSFGLNPVPFVDLGIGFKKKKRPSENIVVEKSKKLKKA